MAKRKKSNAKNKAYVLILAILAAAAVYLSASPRTLFAPAQQEPLADPFIDPFGMPGGGIIIGYHAHADFLVVMDGKEVDFNKREYDYRKPAIHLHIPNFAGDRVMHVESKDATLGDFFSSLGMSLGGNCFSTGSETYCDADEKKLRLFVNGVENNELSEYKPQDLDRVLLTYGSDSPSAIAEQIESVTRYACVFSGSCDVPEEAENLILYN